MTQAIESQVGELLAEYAAGSVPTNPQKEYGHRNGELLITAGARTLTASDSVA